MIVCRPRRPVKFPAAGHSLCSSNKAAARSWAWPASAKHQQLRLKNTAPNYNDQGAGLSLGTSQNELDKKSAVRQHLFGGWAFIASWRPVWAHSRLRLPPAIRSSLRRHKKRLLCFMAAVLMAFKLLNYINWWLKGKTKVLHEWQDWFDKERINKRVLLILLGIITRRIFLSLSVCTCVFSRLVNRTSISSDGNHSGRYPRFNRVTMKSKRNKKKLYKHKQNKFVG